MGAILHTSVAPGPAAGGPSRPAGDADLSAVAQLIAEPARAKALMALADGRWLPASMLAQEASVANSTMSGHLARLVDGGLVTVEARGRYRYFRLANAAVAELVELMARLAPTLTINSLKEDSRAKAIRRARHCYDHFGGRIAVALTAAMVRSGYLDPGGQRIALPETFPEHVLEPIAVTVTEAGANFLADLGAKVPAASAAKCCVDWTEHRHHIAGLPGREILAACCKRQWVVGSPKSRALRLTEAGRAGLEEAFEVNLEAV